MKDSQNSYTLQYVGSNVTVCFRRDWIFRRHEVGLGIVGSGKKKLLR